MISSVPRPVAFAISRSMRLAAQSKRIYLLSSIALLFVANLRKKDEKKSYPTIFFFQKRREFQKYHYICRQKFVPLCPVFIFFSFLG